MKRMFWFAPLALAMLGAVSLSTAPAVAQKNGEVRTRITLAGATINRVVAKGKAEFRTSSRFRALKVQAERVNLADGTVLSVTVNGAAAGTLTLALGRGEIELSTKNGAAVPAIVPGDVVTASTADGMVVLQGKF